MKKILKIIGFTLAVIIVAGLGYVYVSFNYYSPGKVEANPDNARLAFFNENYQDCRDDFRKAAFALKERFSGVEFYSLPFGSKADPGLEVDYCYVPARRDSSKLLILTSGVHGVEGYTGSAIQCMLMQEFLDTAKLADVGILFIHGINAYGFKYGRRVTENNVDFNRNCDIDPSLYSKENTGYTKLYSMLNPDGKVNAGSLKNKFFMLVAINKLMQESMGALRQAVLQGQYQYPEGLYFGGKNQEPQLSQITKMILDKAKAYETVLNIDLHTGYGELGIAHLFPNPVDDPAVKSSMEKIFEGYKIDWGDSDDFYTINGAFSDYIGQLLPGKFYMPMTFEYGTLNSQTTIGSVKSIHNMILENQSKHYGYLSEKDSLRVMKNFIEMYYPSSAEWRSKVMDDTWKLMESSFVQFKNLPVASN
jgi:hypothetical protein